MIKEFTVRVSPETASNEDNIKDFLGREKGLDTRTINQIRILKRSIDARQRNIFINLTVRAYINEYAQDDQFTRTEYQNVTGRPQAVVVGEGPAGLFASLRLIELGIRPVIVERGKDVRERKKDIAAITRNQKVDPASNYSFGEGGAGAYSDGKLFTRSKKRGSVDKILNVFCQHGASTAILADAHPHIGTDKLPRVIENMRKTIIACGGEVHFRTRMTEFITKQEADGTHKIIGIRAEQASANGETRQTEFRGPVILATGHSARDVYEYLQKSGIHIEAKGIAVGVRLEHPSNLIDQIQYHNKNGRGRYLPAAEYRFVTQADGRGVYSFCMCPGGFVIPAATDKEQIVVNGMSPSNRGTAWSNSGMVVETRPEDVAAQGFGDDALAVMRFQQQLEKTCWQQGNMRQTAPAQRMADFVNGKLSYDLPKSSYSPGLISSPLHFWLPQPVAARLQQAFKVFGSHAHGFLTNEAVCIAVETRTSAPVRILRDNDTLEHVELKGLFPCGEGAGYAGGIVSAGVDGERCADMCAQYMHAIE